MLTPYGKLSIAILVYYIPALPFAIWVCARNGFGRHAGWLYLLSMSVVRIVGATLRLAADNSPNNIGLAIGAGILSAIGLVPLLLTLMAMMKRVNDGVDGAHPPARLFQLVHIMTLVALILGIVAGVNSSSTKPSDISSAKTERKAAAILLFVSAIFSSGMAIWFLAHLRRVFKTDRIMTILAAASTPFLLVRIVYVMLLAFDKDPKYSSRTPNIYVQTFMQALMEFIVVGMYLAAGLLCAPIGPDDHQRGRGVELALPGKHRGAYDRSAGVGLMDDKDRRGHHKDQVV